MVSTRARGFWPVRDLPVVGWLAATVLVALAHPFLPAPRWQLIHLVLLPGGAQSLALGPSQGGFVELSLTEPGDYPSVSRVMVDAERGAHGILRVTD